MTDQGRRCPNGHPALFSADGFCEVCGAPLAAAGAPPPGWGQTPQQPMPPQQPAPPAWGATQQPMPPAWSAPQPPQQPAPPPGWGQQPPPPGWYPPPQQPMPPQQPAWGAPPPQGWAPQDQPAWGAPPPKKGGGCGGTLLILIVLLIVGVLAYGFIARPSWLPADAKASTTPALALPTAKPSANSTFTPAPLISVAPVGSGAATTAPTTAPTSGPTTSASGGAGDLATCAAATAGLTVSYPAGWYTVTDYPDWNCMLFDPTPIKFVLNAEVPAVAVQIAQDTRAYAKVVADFKTNTDLYELLDSQTGSVDGLDATAIYIRHTGNGLMAKGMEELVVVVNRGSLGSLTLEVIDMPGATFDANAQVLGTMISNIKINK